MSGRITSLLVVAFVALGTTAARAGYMDYVNSLGPEAYWRLNGAWGSGAEADSSGHNHAATAYSNPGVTFNQSAQGLSGDPSNTAASFDGSRRSYVSVPNSSCANLQFSSGNTITVGAWVWSSNFGSACDTILAMGRTTSDISTSCNYSLRTVGSGALDFYFSGSNGWNVYRKTLTTPLAANTWYYIAATYTFNSGQGATFYVNGAAAGGSASWASGNANTAPLATTQDLWIGSDAYSTAETWPGLIDEVVVFRRALSAGEIQGLANVNSNVPEPATLAFLAVGGLGLPMIYRRRAGAFR